MSDDPKAINPPYDPLPAYLGDPFAPANRRPLAPPRAGYVPSSTDQGPQEIERPSGHNRRSRKGHSHA